MTGQRLTVPPFRLALHGQTFVCRAPVTIDLRMLAPGRYRILAVQNFQVEDRNPDLSECQAGVFLAGRRADGTWEEPERYPVECRTLVVIAGLDVAPASEHGQDAR